MTDITSVLATTAVLTFMSLYPFYLKKYNRRKYRGLWETLGEMLKTPERAIIYPLGWLIVNLLYIIFFE
jgi:hypothetical protein